MANLSGNNLLVSSSIQYVINVLLTVPALIFVDRWGRRPTYVFSELLHPMQPCSKAKRHVQGAGHPIRSLPMFKACLVTLSCFHKWQC